MEIRRYSFSLGFAVFLLISLLGSTLAMAIVYVDDDSTCVTECGTGAAPWPTIQEALNAASEGDMVLVEDGEYTEDIQWPVVNGIHLKSRNGKESVRVITHIAVGEIFVEGEGQPSRSRD